MVKHTQTTRQQSMFDHFVGLVFKRLKLKKETRNAVNILIISFREQTTHPFLHTETLLISL